MSKRHPSSCGRHTLCALLSMTVILAIVGPLLLAKSDRNSSGLAGLITPRTPWPADSPGLPNAPGTMASTTTDTSGHLQRRTDSPNSAGGSQAGSGARSGIDAAQPDPGASSRNPSDTEQPPAKRPKLDDNLSSSGDSHRLKPFGTNSALSTGGGRGNVKTDSGERDFTRALVGFHRNDGITWKQWMKAREQELPQDARGVTPGMDGLRNSGYSYRSDDERVLEQLKRSIEWVRTNDQSLPDPEERADVWSVGTWKHAKSAGERSPRGGSMRTLGDPIMDASFKTVVYPEWKMLVALEIDDPLHTAEGPQRSPPSTPSSFYDPNEPKSSPPKTPSPGRQPVRVADAATIPPYWASDIWHNDWTLACNNPVKAASLSYILIPFPDKPTTDSLRYAVHQWWQRQKTMEVWPGHLVEAESEDPVQIKLGTVLIGTPTVGLVARLLVQHKATYGEQRTIQSIRFWETEGDVLHPDGSMRPVISVLVTLNGGVDGFNPAVNHWQDFDEGDLDRTETSM